MPRIKKTKTTNVGATTHSQKGISSGRKKITKSTASVVEMLQTLNSKTSDTTSQPSAGPARRQTGRGRKTNVSRGSDGGSGTPVGRRRQSAVRGGRGRGRVSGRTDAAKDSSQEDKRTERGTGVKRKQKTRDKDQEVSMVNTNSNQGKQRRRTVQRKALDDDDYLERQLPAQSVAKWQTMTKTSHEFLHQITDSAISVVLSETSGSSYDGVQDHLNNLKKRLMASFVSLKVPNKRQPNYMEMEQHTQTLEAVLVETSNQVECLDKQVQLQEQLLEQKEEELEKLEAADQQDSHDNHQDINKRLHPLLQDDRQDVLGLPPLRRISNNHTSNQFEDVRNSCQQPVLETLRHLSQTRGEGAAAMTEFIDAVSAIQAALPK